MKRPLVKNNLITVPYSPLLNFDRSINYQLPGNQFLSHIKKISAQKEKLKKIGQIMSHDVRQPLACIMGLINAIRDDNYIFDKEMLAMLEKEAHDLDSKIKAIVALTD
jgi:K+-sensing histidine kinase KdpD